MADQKSIDNNISNNNISVKEIPLTRAEYLKSKFVVTPERLANYLLKESIRRREEREKRRQEGSYDGDKAGDNEAYKRFFTNFTPCLDKPPCGPEAWFRYRDELALEKAAAAAASSTCHDDDGDAPGRPTKKLKVNEQEALEGGHETIISTQKVAAFEMDA